MKKIVIGMVSCLLVLSAYAVLARTPEQARNPPVTLPRPDLPPENGSPKQPKEFPPVNPRREFPIGHPANPASPR